MLEYLTHSYMFIYDQVHSRLRSRIAEQLMNELELDQQNTIIQLEELQLDSSRSKEIAY